MADLKELYAHQIMCENKDGHRNLYSEKKLSAALEYMNGLFSLRNAEFLLKIIYMLVIYHHRTLRKQ
jgi:hypothetical protein